MMEVMVAMASQLSAYTQEADRKLNSRLDEFRGALLEEISKPGNETSSEAFSDPDYQFALQSAQKSFVRDGSEKLRNELVGLLVQRSKVDPADRVAKILNHALETVGNLSQSEHATLAIGFLFSLVKVGGINQKDFFSRFSKYTSPFISELTDNPSCFEYLESQRCINLNVIMNRDLSSILETEYGSFLGEGFDNTQLTSIPAPDGIKSWHDLIGSTGNPIKPFYFLSPNQDELSKELTSRGFEAESITLAATLYQSTRANVDAIVSRFDDEITGFSRVNELWKSTAFQHMSLTAVGKVIAHSALAARGEFETPLSIWVS